MCLLQTTHTVMGELVKKGKNCIAVIKTVVDDIDNGCGESATRKLGELKNDSEFLAKEAAKLAKRLEAVDKHYQDKDAEILVEVGNLSRTESELKSQQESVQSQLAGQRSLLQDNESRLSSAETMLQDAERKRRKAEKEEKNIQIGSAVGGAVLGLFTGGLGLLVGAGVGASIGAIVNACRDEEKDARDAVNCRKADITNARSAVSASESRISSIQSDIRSLSSRIESYKQQRLECHKKADEVKAVIKIVKEAVEFWFLFQDISKDGAKTTGLLKKIVTKATERGDYQALEARGSKRVFNTFLDAWETLEEMTENGSTHVFEIEYTCARCSGHCNRLPLLDNSKFVCQGCHSRFAVQN